MPSPTATAASQASTWVGGGGGVRGGGAGQRARRPTHRPTHLHLKVQGPGRARGHLHSQLIPIHHAHQVWHQGHRAVGLGPQLEDAQRILLRADIPLACVWWRGVGAQRMQLRAGR